MAWRTTSPTFADFGLARRGGVLGAKDNAKVVHHDRYVTCQMAGIAVPCDLLRKIMSLIDDLRRRHVAA